MDFSEDGKLRINGLTVTLRGKYFLKHDLYWSFSYLAMVLEDHWLEIPNQLREHFDSPKGAMFLGKVADGDFERLYLDFLFEKAKSVPVFLQLLEAAFDSERSKNRALFKILLNRGLKFPSFERIRIRCREDLVQLLVLKSMQG